MHQRPRHLLLRRVAVAFSLALLFSFLPLPNFDFVSVAGAASVPLPTLAPVTAGELAVQQAAADEPLSQDRVVGLDESVDEFSMIGVTFESEPAEPVMVRTRNTDGSWEDWRELEFEVDEGPDAGTAEGAPGFGTAPVWVDGANAYELSLGTDDAADADVVVVRDEEQRVITESTPMAGAAPGLEDIRLRSAWGARAATGTSYASTVRLAVVHHSASSNSYSAAEVPSVLRSTQAFHMDGRGWSDIAYNFVVDKYGGIWEGRGGGIDRPVIGAHAMGFNTGSVGVMVLGDYTQASPTSASLESVSRTIGWKLALHNVDPSGSVTVTSGGSTSIPAGQVVTLPVVVGHQNVGSTSCPGSIQGHLGSIRGRSQEWTNWIRPQIAPRGNLEAVTTTPGVVNASGWAIDMGRDGPAQVRLDVAGRTTTVAASGSRPDVGAAYPGYTASGFGASLSGIPPGLQQACVRALSAFSSNYDAVLGCQRVYVQDPTGQSPVGALTASSGGWGTATVSGWALDPNTSGAVTVDVAVDGYVRTSTTASLASNAVPSSYANQVGTNHGFSVGLVGLTGGSREVCIRVRNVGAGSDVLADCRVVNVGGANPIGSLDAATVSGRTIVMSGWSLDPETVLSTNVLLVVENRWYVVLANGTRPDVAAAYPGYGATHGFSGFIEASPGTHRVCAYGMNFGGGTDSALGCLNVTVPK